MRLFIAISLEDKIKSALSNIQKKLKIERLHPKWVEPKNCHLTLKFLGEVEKERVYQIIKACEGIKQEPFTISFGNIGAFPKPDYPRVIWIGIEKGKEHLSSLANSLENSLEKIGFVKEKRQFSPHLTIARIKNPQKTSILSPYLSSILIPDEMDAKEMHLIESKLTPSGPIYTIIQSLRLNVSLG